MIAILRAQGERIQVGEEWKMLVVGRRDADLWNFKFVGRVSIKIALGEFTALHFIKAPPADAKDQQLDLWLAPALEYYPIRLRFSDANGDFVDQVLESLN